MLKLAYGALVSVNETTTSLVDNPWLMVKVVIDSFPIVAEYVVPAMLDGDMALTQLVPSYLIT